MKIGFIGLGTMGAHMAANLQKAGHDLIVHDVRRDAADSHIVAGATWGASPQAVGADAEVVFLSLPVVTEVSCSRIVVLRSLSGALIQKLTVNGSSERSAGASTCRPPALSKRMPRRPAGC